MNERLKELLVNKQLSHVGSCDTAYNGISAVYDLKQLYEKFVLSNGHAGLALYVVLEEHGLGNAEELLLECGTHPDRLVSENIYCSTGSLGQGLPIAVGMALADKSKNVYCMISDGECSEGSIWESLKIISDLKIDNLKLLVNSNGWGAYGKIDRSKLFLQISSFVNTVISENTKEAILENLKNSQAIFIISFSEQGDHYEKITS